MQAGSELSEGLGVSGEPFMDLLCLGSNFKPGRALVKFKHIMGVGQ